MADGDHTFFGAVAMAGAMGSRWRVLGGGNGWFTDMVFTVADRYGWGTQFDIAMPGQCGRAIVYGRQVIEIEPVP